MLPTTAQQIEPRLLLLRKRGSAFVCVMPKWEFGISPYIPSYAMNL